MVFRLLLRAVNPPTKAEAWFPNDHMITGLTDRMTDNYLGGSDNSYVEMSWVVGIKRRDREASGFDQYSQMTTGH